MQASGGLLQSEALLVPRAQCSSKGPDGLAASEGTSLRVCAYVRVCMYVYMCVYVCVHMFVCMCIRACLRVCVHVRICVYVYICMFASVLFPQKHEAILAGVEVLRVRVWLPAVASLMNSKLDKVKLEVEKYHLYTHTRHMP